MKKIQEISKMVRNGQITIPAKIRRLLNLIDGDLVRMDVDSNHLIITPLAIVEKDQAYFYNKDVQNQVKESEGDIKKGKITSYTDADDIEDDLR